MNWLLKKENLIISLIAISLSATFIIILLLPSNFWYKTFVFLNIPAGGINLADAKSIVHYSEIYIEKGFVGSNDVDFWNRKFNSINIIWKEMAIFFKFYKQTNFYIFIFISFFIYIFSFLKIASVNNKKLDFLIITFFFFTTSSFYLIERGNFDLILFGFVTLLCFLKKTKYQLGIIILLSFLKIYLVYLFFVLIKNIKTFFYYSLLVIIILLINYKFILSGYIEIGNSASIIHYGIFTITKSILYFFDKIMDFDISKYRHYIHSSFFITSFVIILLYFFKELKNINIKIKEIDLEFLIIEKLFLTGSFFYIFSFITFSSPDYKLVFLILSLPYLLYKKLFFKIFIIFIIMNSCIFETYPLFQNIFNGEPRIYVDKYSIKYLTLGFVIHALKILIFILLLRESLNIYKKKLLKFRFIN